MKHSIAMHYLESSCYATISHSLDRPCDDEEPLMDARTRRALVVILAALIIAIIAAATAGSMHAE